ncbi:MULTISPECIES: HdeD family acid-resistance protein [Bradyrhizobium]|uniref:HdeD family acid-resistance protein n=1 Tax=Bradyrhizobium TaxID=374 RepID=UPI0003FA5C0E|nr:MULTISPECIES: HdeD family acid-resistance protein [Bradyrhizobium]QOG20747.1 HdeD family acid-resistance protein [Bradyrhizobium sp. SEMIA]UFW52766.1 HdeD family acid-resistance protein [Bradyrhizobium arachidis]
MTDLSNSKASLGRAIHAITGKWGWFVALGIGELILGGIASANLMAASLASVLAIGATMAVAGVFQIVHAFSAHGLRGFLFWLLAGIVYGAAGAVILYDPLLASFTLSIVVCAFLVVAGATRIWAGFHMRPAAGWRWIVAAGVVTFCVGVFLLSAWPAIGLWLLGAMLVVDLIFQGWGFIAFGLALRSRASRHSTEPATV